MVACGCFIMYDIQGSAMVTSTSTPGSIEMDVICFTISDGECKSITRLWIRIWKYSRGRFNENMEAYNVE